ncbi:hypothetical protein H0H92_012144 [Tricholoma furcatifolium]|nr:hypothetical protein H0H92_012144 [Tricholoma furcatifolium]
MIVLHPKLKTKYFQQNSWSKQWVQMALNIIHKEWGCYKAKDTGVAPSSSLLANLTDNFRDIPMQDIDNLDELDIYLSQPLERVSDPPCWWYDYRAAFPQLSRMAFDYLSIPATSTAVEPSIHAIMSLEHWSCKDLIDCAEVVTTIKACHQRKDNNNEDFDGDAA